MVENPFKTQSSKEVYDTPWIQVWHDEVIKPNGEPGIYGRIHFKNIAVGVVPIDEEGYTWLVGQYRYPLKAYSWEIVEGGCPEGEDVLEAAKRELLEETGIIAQDYTHILKLHLSNSASDETAHIYVAKNLTFTQAQPEDTEVLQIKKVHLSEAMEMVENGEITDAMSVSALLKLNSNCQL